MKSKLSRTVCINISPAPQRKHRGTRLPPAIAPLSPGGGFTELLNHLYDATLVTDLKGQIVYTNPRAIQFLQFDALELRCLRAVDLISGANTELFDAIMKNLENEMFTFIEAYCLRKDTSLFPAEIVISKIHDGPNIRLCFFIRDVTRRKKVEEALQESEESLRRAHDELERRVLERTAELSRVNTQLIQEIDERRKVENELEQARDDALESDRFKSEFLANISHEFRTPLNGIIGMNHLLLDSPLDSDQREYVDTMKSCSESLLQLINNVLDFSRLESGQFRLEARDVPIESTIRRTLSDFIKIAEAKNLTFDILLDVSLPEIIHVDPQRFSQILTCLVDNAVKFTSRGRIQTRFSCTHLSPEKHLLHCEIEDTGTGIAPNQHRALFTTFAQGDGSSTRKHGGTGIGLPLTKRLVEKMGGTLTFTSTLGEGSTFRFELPFQRPTDGQSRTPLFDLERLKQITDNSRPHMIELVSLYLSQTRDQLKKIREALAIEAWQEVHQIVLSCVGASSTCGATAMIPIMQQLEKSVKDHDARLSTETLKKADQLLLQIHSLLQLNFPELNPE